MQLSLRVIFSTVLLSSAPVIAAETCSGWRNPASTKIVGGDPATLAHWPSIAALRLSSPDGKETQFICGGTAIAGEWVMTAAHCFDDINQERDGRLLSTEDSTHGWGLDVVLGVDDLTDITSKNVFAIAERRVHEGYVPKHAIASGEDIALIRLGRSWTGALANLSLDTSTDPAAGAGLMVAGFGLTKGQLPGGHMEHSNGVSAGALRLLHVGLPSVTTSDCAARWLGRKVGAGQICAGFDVGTTRRDSCNGDSGGPLNAYDSRGCPVQVGLVSWGATDCGELKTYGVYTRISYQAPWLQRHVRGLKSSTTGRPTTGNDLAATEFVAEVQALVGNAGKGVTIAVKPAGPIRLDGKFAFEARSNITGRLVIIDVNADGIATQIFPNEFVGREDLSLVKAGQTITVPGPGYGFDNFRAAPPLGRGKLIALVVPLDLPLQSFLSAPSRSKGFVPERSATGYFMNLLQQIRAHLSEHRSEGGADAPSMVIADIEYEIVR